MGLDWARISLSAGDRSCGCLDRSSANVVVVAAVVVELVAAVAFAAEGSVCWTLDWCSTGQRRD